jgi:hypothetical protein
MLNPRISLLAFIAAAPRIEPQGRNSAKTPGRGDLFTPAERFSKPSHTSPAQRQVQVVRPKAISYQFDQYI